MIVFYIFIAGRASFAQERIFLDEEIRYAKKRNHLIYLIPHIYRITPSHNSVSISRLRHAFEAMLTKHSVLRTALYFNCDGTIMQRCLKLDVIDTDMESNGFSVIDFHPDEKSNLNVIISNIMHDPNLFDLSKGRVIRCHILRQHRPADDVILANNDYLVEGDLISFSIHHSVFDGVSKALFFRDLAHAYKTNESIVTNDNELQYIDYAINERVVDTTLSQKFWQTELEGYNLQNRLSLPFDRQRPPTYHRSDFGYTAEIVLNNEISTAFLEYASVHHVTLFQLGLATFYAFLFKLTHGQNDLCISSVNANRYRSELQNMIGMFVSISPCRMKLDGHQSFDDVVQDVRTKALSILDHSRYSLQNILADLRLNQSNASFLETVFDFSTVSRSVSHFSLEDADLEPLFIKQLLQVAKFDFSLSFLYDNTFDNNQLSFALVCSHDMFNERTVTDMARRLNYFLSQLFQIQSRNTDITDSTLSIDRLSVILPEEVTEMQSTVFQRINTVANQGMYFN